MKQFLTLILSLLMLSSLLTSCARESKTEGPENEVQSHTALTEEGEEEIIQSTVEQEDPAADGILNVIIIGNSFSTGWPDELKGLFSETDIQLNIYSVYYSGCSVQQHWEWLQADEHNYRLNHHLNDSGKRTAEEGKSLVECLSRENWDVISLQQHFGPSTAPSYDDSLASCVPYAENLFDWLKWNFPKSKLVWNQTWAYEVKREGADQSNSVPDEATQLLCHENIKAVSQKIATDNKVTLIPCGDAFHIARQNGSGDLSRDGYHDGPENGGQYLNACVWFEMLTGQSCVGSQWRPSYNFDEYKVPILQNAAHQAVTENSIIF